MIQKAGRRIIGYINIDKSISVEITGYHPEPVIAVGVRDSCLDGNIRELAVAIVVKEPVACSRQPSGPTLNRHSFVLTRSSLSKFRQVIDVKIDISGNEEIQLAVIVVVEEGGARRPLR